MSSGKRSPTMIIFSYMAQGHMLPLIHLAKALSQKDVNVIFITTPSNSTQISSVISNEFSKISIHIIPFPIVDDLPLGIENTKDLTSRDQVLPLLKASLKLKEPFESFLREMVKEQDSCDDPSLCVICDFIVGWAVPICNSLKIPTIVFYGMGVIATAISRFANMHVEYIKGLSSDDEIATLPGLASPFPLTRDDFPQLFDDNNPMQRFLDENGRGDECRGMLVNSFEELEGDFVATLESSFKQNFKVWCVGPLFLYDQIFSKNNAITLGVSSSKPHHFCEKWLDEQEREDSVIYVAFGTQSVLSNAQMDEIAAGLAMSGERFIWIVRSTTWAPPEGWEEKVDGKGLLVRDWVDQRRILAHRAIGGFLSHCGWNSTLESLSMGVPLLGWAMGAEQPRNVKLLVQVLKAGIPLHQFDQVLEGEGKNFEFESRTICSGVRELMSGDEGNLARNRAKEIGKMARNAVENDGSSSKTLDQLIKSVCDMGKKAGNNICYSMTGS